MTRTRLRWAAYLLVVGAAASGCTQTVPGTGEYFTSSIAVADARTEIKGLPGGKPTAVDTIAGNAVADIQQFWTDEFPKVFNGRSYRSPQGGFYSVDPDHAADVPCVSSPDDIRGNAFYCPSRDIVAWDRTNLLPSLRSQFGPFLVAMVLAHEWGHVVQNKSHADPKRTIVDETQADCYAGSWTRWALEGQAPHFPIQRTELDEALSGYLLFRDPVGSSARDQDAHGNGFDRISAFQEGFEQGPKHCTTFDNNRQFTETGFTSTEDQQRNGNLPLDDQTGSSGAAQPGAITLGKQDLNETWPTLYRKVYGSSFRVPAVTEHRAGQATTCAGSPVDKAVLYCAQSNTVYFDRSALRTVTEKVRGSDYAPMTLIGIGYAESAAAQAGRSIDGADGLRRAICLDGAYTRVVTDRSTAPSGTGGLILSPGDLDEAVEALLSFAGQDAYFGARSMAGFDRVQAFRQGFTDSRSCA
ncbi:MAG: neutral zinc metallopeptidase [Actinobacteria bacterium]|nr:neutral zinc metallopeptidase [Actinomycetota bacterium]